MRLRRLLREAWRLASVRIASLALVLAFVALSVAVSLYCLWAGWNPCIGPGCFPGHGEPQGEAPATVAGMTQEIRRELARPERPVVVETAEMWVAVANPTPVAHQGRSFLRGESCFVRPGLKAILVSEAHGAYLLRYAPRLNPAGSECPDGTLFYLPAGGGR